MPSVISRFRNWTLTTALLFLLSLVAGCFVSRRFIFPAKGREGSRLALPGRLVTLSHEGRKVFAWLSENGKRIVYVFHGSRKPMEFESRFARKFHDRGYSTALIEYPGYGRAKDFSPTEGNLYGDSEAMIRHLAKKYGYHRENSYAWGRSLGTGVVAEMMKRKLISRGILVTPYTSLSDVGSDKFIPVLPKILIWDDFNTLSKAPGIREPVLLIHGTKDDLVRIVSIFFRFFSGLLFFRN